MAILLAARITLTERGCPPGVVGIRQHVSNGRYRPREVPCARCWNSFRRQATRDLPARHALQRLTEDALYHRRLYVIDLIPSLCVISKAITVEWLPTGYEFAGLRSSEPAAHRQLLDLLVLNFGGVAADKADELSFGGVVEWFGHEEHLDTSMFSFGEHNAQVDGVTA